MTCRSCRRMESFILLFFIYSLNTFKLFIAIVWIFLNFLLQYDLVTAIGVYWIYCTDSSVCSPLKKKKKTLKSYQ